MLMPDSVSVPVPALVRPLPAPEITPEKVVLALSPPAVRLLPSTTLPAPASEPMVSAPLARVRVAPESTVVVAVSEREEPPLTDRVPVETVVAPV